MFKKYIISQLKYIELPPFCGFYKTQNLAVPLSARCCSEACHLLTVFTNSKVFFAHIITIVNSEIIHELEMIFLILFQAI